jgi:hypothetical protein
MLLRQVQFMALRPTMMASFLRGWKDNPEPTRHQEHCPGGLVWDPVVRIVGVMGSYTMALTWSYGTTRSLPRRVASNHSDEPGRTMREHW